MVSSRDCIILRRWRHSARAAALFGTVPRLGRAPKTFSSKHCFCCRPGSRSKCIYEYPPLAVKVMLICGTGPRCGRVPEKSASKYYFFVPRFALNVPLHYDGLMTNIRYALSTLGLIAGAASSSSCFFSLLVFVVFVIVVVVVVVVAVVFVVCCRWCCCFRCCCQFRFFLKYICSTSPPGGNHG